MFNFVCVYNNSFNKLDNLGEVFLCFVFRMVVFNLLVIFCFCEVYSNLLNGEFLGLLNVSKVIVCFSFFRNLGDLLFCLVSWFWVKLIVDLMFFL